MNHLNVIKEELGLLENKLIEFISSEITLATEISEYIVASGGKRIRPTLCILTGKALSYEEENLINLSAAIELDSLTILLTGSTPVMLIVFIMDNIGSEGFPSRSILSIFGLPPLHPWPQLTNLDSAASNAEIRYLFFF